MSVSVTLKSYFYEVLIPSSQKNTSSPIEDILHHVSISFMKKLALYKSFNPRTHTGCDKTEPPALYNQTVSIHAPTRGATTVMGYSDVNRIVSIHAPTRGATNIFVQINHIYHVSIHAPTRGATCYLLHLWKIRSFQSTHPHGVRPGSPETRLSLAGFNPRTHTGCDSVQSYIL